MGLFRLLKRNNCYYFNRRVPKDFVTHDNRKFIRLSLKTKDYTEAVKKALSENEALESHWQFLKDANKKHGQSDYSDVVANAQKAGLIYLPSEEILLLKISDIVERALILHKNFTPGVAETVLGGVPTPQITIQSALELYWELTKDKLLKKSDAQRVKWRNTRAMAIRYFISCVGNKPINQITRDDIIAFKDWWVMRIENEGKVPGSANKCFMYVKAVMETASDHFKMELDIRHLFRRVMIADDKTKRRNAFETDYIKNVLLNAENLKGLNRPAYWILHIIAETGMSASEILGLTCEDIDLKHEIPHVIITPNEKKSLKTKYRTRTIPLVGYALDAFQAYPNGFSEHYTSSDHLSNTMNKYLRENGLLPSKKYSVYSLRHSFQDRILAVNAPDRVQADLMGHKFSRESYGNGSSLKHKLEWLEKINLKH